jgi:hypothetical protein
MRRNRIQKLFDDWRRRNRERFPFPPYVLRQRPGRYTVAFAGIAPGISLHLGHSAFGVSVRLYKGRGGGDELVDFDIAERRTADGRWFCGFCTEPAFYQTRRELWERHSFEPFMEWMRENFRHDKWLCLFAMEDGWVWNARIVDENELPEAQERKDFSRAVQVVRAKSDIPNQLGGEK